MNKRNPKNLKLLITDVLILIISFLFMSVFTGAYASAESGWHFVLHGLLISACVFAVRYFSEIYRRLWRYAQFEDYLLLILADTSAGLVIVAIEHLLLGIVADIKPLAMYALMLPVMFSLIAAIGVRTLYQFYRKLVNEKELKNREEEENSSPNDDKIKVAIIGAGTKGVQLAEMLRTQSDGKYEPYCFIDTDAHKIGTTISGLKVIGVNESEASSIQNLPIDEVIIAINNISEELRAALFDIYTKAGKRVRIYEYPLGTSYEKKSLTIRDINIEDLLFRYSVDFSSKELFDYYSGKTVLVTGGGGTIGSELCRQIAKTSPKKLIILDIYENNAYDIQQELKRAHGNRLNLCVEIASVRDAEKINRLFLKHRPDVVFHAAAHKKFIMISTDKAVNPTNVMGATKRFCEMLIQSRNNSSTCFVAVRFGNVLGSNGSVIPLFMKQIEEGGPITITDKRIIRYFMTIREASQLVMAAGASASKSEIYVLDMGKPVKILDLAVNMIRLAGYTPYKDIEIKEIGLRPGEKLYEELLLNSEKLDKTENKKIFIERDKYPTREQIEQKLALLREALLRGNCDYMREVMKKIVPTYTDPDIVNERAEKSKEMKNCLKNADIADTEDDIAEERPVVGAKG